jgi:hypothetical protein
MKSSGSGVNTSDAVVRRWLRDLEERVERSEATVERLTRELAELRAAVGVAAVAR